ncbi:MAG TPA: hypothetical protein P5277_00865 [Candidatus Paceibacterota bacterium]|nr:hypothetical protein [Candidatus Paceibacterota bacterium]
MAYQVSIEYDGSLENFSMLSRVTMTILELITLNERELLTDMTEKGYGTDKYLLYRITKKEKAEKFRRKIIEKGLAEVVYVDEI